MNGVAVNEEELDGILSRVFAQHLVPFELRLVIWAMAFVNCASCNLLYPNSSLHNCAVFGISCPSCIPSHFCLSIDEAPPKPLEDLIPCLLRMNLPVPGLPRMDVTSLSCISDPSRKEYVLTGFKQTKAASIHEALEFLRDVVGRLAYVYSHITLHKMKIEYVKGVFE
jgi:hypothetical protein